MPASQLKRLRASLREQPPSKRQKRTPLAPTRQDKGQQLRAQTLLPELRQRHKVGGIVDRRIGENDPRLDPEQRMLQRYAAENQRSKRASIFNLEEAEDDILTHGGRRIDTLPADEVERDDYEESEVDVSDEDEKEVVNEKARRMKELREQVEEMQQNEPDRKKSKKEVMEEVIAKSKLHKYERQKTKEDDEDIREELDKSMPDLLNALRGLPKGADMVNGTDKTSTSREYDERVRQMALDKRAQPTVRTKTEEEKIFEEAERLKSLEEARLRRMKGEEGSDDNDEPGDDADVHADDEYHEDDANEAAEFGLGLSDTKGKKQYTDVEAEDEFEIDEDLLASGSDVDIDLSDESDVSSEADSAEDDEFLKDVLPNGVKSKDLSTINGDQAYTYSCPQTLQAAMSLFSTLGSADIPTAVQRIRALYHPQLDKDNKAKMAKFSVVLVDFISDQVDTLNLPLETLEIIIRHVHSLSRTHGDAIAAAFRARLNDMHERKDFSQGDLIALAAIGSIYPTSDHFHQVVTPALTMMARWLGLTAPKTTQVSLNGAYIVMLCIKYVSFSRRYIPETVNFTAAALAIKDLPESILSAHTANVMSMMELWAEKSSSIEIFEPLLPILKSAGLRKARHKLRIMLDQAQHRRRALELHHHRPLPIKMSIPRFEDSFNPDKHYDPDKARSEANKLRKEYKREQKGAMRELKKDSEFMARERLKEKRIKDAAYEAKQRRLIAEIQQEEGREANAYEREKKSRKGKK